MLFSLFLSHRATRSKSNFSGFYLGFLVGLFVLAGFSVVGWLVVVICFWFGFFLGDRNCKIVHFLSRCSDVLQFPCG